MQSIPEDNVKDIPRPFRILPIRLRGLNTGRLLSIKQAPVHRLIDAGTLRRNDLASWGRPLWGLPIDTTGHIFTAYGKVSSSDIGFMRAMEFLR
jgi:hypothetical protein